MFININLGENVQVHSFRFDKYEFGIELFHMSSRAPFLRCLCWLALLFVAARAVVPRLQSNPNHSP